MNGNATIHLLLLLLGNFVSNFSNFPRQSICMVEQ